MINSSIFIIFLYILHQWYISIFKKKNSYISFNVDQKNIEKFQKFQFPYMINSSI